MSLNQQKEGGSLLEFGEYYLKKGFSVIPVNSKEKQGSYFKWKPYQKRKATSKELVKWINDFPSMGLAIVTGKISNIIVLDIDPENGGNEAIQGKELPDTLTVKTGSGGFHYYYKYPENFSEIKNFVDGGKADLPGVDLRADGGYVYAPPSLHPSGNQYNLINECELADLPQWLMKVIEQNQISENGTKITPEKWSEKIPQGRRNNELVKRAGSLLSKMKPTEAETMLQAYNKEHCSPPLPEHEVKSIIDSIAEIEKSEPTKFNKTDAGNAERLASHYSNQLRYCHTWQKWLVYDGRRWAVDEKGQAASLALQTIRNIYKEGSKIEDYFERRALIQFALRNESANKIKAMLDIAKSLLPISANELDQNKWLINTNNCTLDLKNNKILKHDPKHFITKKINVEYKKNAKCPEWLRFLDMIFDGDKDIIRFIQKSVGYSLTGITDERCMFLLYGNGKNGKSTLVEIIAKLAGDYAMRTPTQTLMEKRYDGIPNDVARLQGARLVYAAESKEGRGLSESMIKDLTGCDTISARYMRGEWFDFKPEFKLWLSTNHKPNIKGTDNAIWDRIRLIPFNVRIPKSKMRSASEVDAMFEAEMPGILNWALEGLNLYKKEGLHMPDAIRQATEGYRSEMDVLSEFFNDCCVIENTKEVSVKELYECYTKWCEKNGDRPISKRNFGSRLTEKGFTQYQGKGGKRIWIGVEIIND